MKKLVVIGGGAAGFFAAVNAAELNKDLQVTILEGSNKVLQKVKVSGGGRCNVTHACFVPQDLVRFYPRGEKELLGPFHTFMTGDTMDWFEKRGVPLKIEDDNRVFPQSDSSQSIIDCLLKSAEKAGVKLFLSTRVDSLEKFADGFKIGTNNGVFNADFVLVSTGSNSKIWEVMQKLGHTVVPPVSSLFTFNSIDIRLKDIPGISVANATITVKDLKLEEKGAILITHWGLSGPAVLKLSAWGAREFHKNNYNFNIEINWLSQPYQSVLGYLKKLKSQQPKKVVMLQSAFAEIPKRLWEKLVLSAGINQKAQWANLNNTQIEALTKELVQCTIEIDGKSTFKDEFVTAGGVDLKEINFKRFESKLHNNLFFAGEVLNIDAVTGGFNFQNAWTGGWIVANAVNN